MQLNIREQSVCVSPWCFWRVCKIGGQSIILLVTASVYKRPQTAAAPTLSSPCSKHRSANERKQSNLMSVYDFRLGYVC